MLGVSRTLKGKLRKIKGDRAHGEIVHMGDKLGESSDLWKIEGILKIEEHLGTFGGFLRDLKDNYGN